MAYSDTTNEVLTLAFDRLRGVLSDELLEGMKRLAADGRLDAPAVKALLEGETDGAEDR